ncbi:MAG: polyribonucleotide nucleotidyltransferase [Chloroflexi bacterium]|nr:polyribonucleotide nucleotidyltransferase [Chloroflexota bacterium]MCL5074370.1 polyribonucleotide nucleotidyltransferase [Chloroflexota bacterium]
MHQYEITIGGRQLQIETGQLAEQANGAVTVRYGDTLVLATATASKERRPDIDFFPLTVDYEERLYAAGKIPGGFFKREGRPSEQAILTCRLTDRSMRPLFPKAFHNDVQIIVTVLSADQENEPDVLSIVGASAALSISDIPFDGPVGAVRIGYINNQFVLNPTTVQLELSQLDLVVAGTANAVVMVESGAKEVPEEIVLEAIKFGQVALQDIVKMQERMVEEIGQPKMQYSVDELDEEIKVTVEKIIADKLAVAVNQTDKMAREEAREALKQEVLDQLGEHYDHKYLLAAVEDLERTLIRHNILTEGCRPDGRDLTTIRPITCEVGLLPRTHGSGLFTRGQTQVLTIATLGSISDEQIIDGLGLEESKRFMHHYNFPPFSVGEVRRMGSPGRREIGHGALAERALAPIIPDTIEFPYTIRLVSEVLSSNGSTSMASVCASTLSLMDAGVPIKAPVAGVAMGLITDEKNNFAILTDIQGIEDHLGDMDFKVAGTARGITALQMDVKVPGLSYDIMQKALTQARDARLFILDRMLETIAHSRPELSPHAPHILRTTIPVDKIGVLIGPGGRNIRSLQEEMHVKIDVEDDGSVFISSPDADASQRALLAVERLTKDVELGAVYLGHVTRLSNFGAFVEILPGKEGLVRTAELAEYHVSRPEDVVRVGDEIMVKVIEIDSQGRINLSRRTVLEGTTSQTDAASKRATQVMPGDRFQHPRRPAPPHSPERERRLTGPSHPEQRQPPRRPFGKRW